jgi:hypothetical protein
MTKNSEKQDRHIPNNELTLEDIPPPYSNRQEIRHLAYSFFGYEHWGSFGKCAGIANKWNKAFRENSSLPETLTELRTCLFFEGRRSVHQCAEPDMKYIHALVEAIRKKVIDKKFD